MGKRQRTPPPSSDDVGLRRPRRRDTEPGHDAGRIGIEQVISRRTDHRVMSRRVGTKAVTSPAWVSMIRQTVSDPSALDATVGESSPRIPR